MSKNKLIKLLEPFEGEEEIFAWWDEHIFKILNVSIREELNSGNRKEVICIDCPSS